MERIAVMEPPPLPASLPPPAPEKTVLVLSGGGSNGAVEVGFYKAIHEFGIKIDQVIGTSVGAINGAMIASGLPPDEIMNRWHQARPGSFLKWNWRELVTRGMRARSLYDPQALRKFLKEAIPARTFEELAIPFMAVATDALTGEPAPFEGGDLISAVQASCAIPAIYPPMLLNGRQYVDGGVSRQVPIDLAIDCGATTTIVAMAECRSNQRTEVHSFLETWMRAFTLAINRGVLSPGYLEIYSLRTRLILLEPCFRLPIAPKHIFDMRNTDILMKFAYEFAKGKLEQEGFPPPATTRLADSVFGN
jgi:NTE family protein